jgi:NAD(P)-dependent dehydrogenase (short-subunit alcohol dehydrogenase family)
VIEVLVARGDSLVGTARSSSNRESLDDPDTIDIIECDVTDEGQICAAVETARTRLGGIDSLIYLPGVNLDGSSSKVTAGRMTESLAVNVVGAFVASREALVGANTTSCAITVIGTTNALRGVPGQAAYAAGKASLIGMTRALAAEYGPRGHRLNVVSPGYLNSGMATQLPERVRHNIERQIPMRRFAELREVAEVIAFVASDKSTYMNGSVVYVDGGLAMGH